MIQKILLVFTPVELTYAVQTIPAEGMWLPISWLSGHMDKYLSSTELYQGKEVEIKS